MHNFTDYFRVIVRVGIGRTLSDNPNYQFPRLGELNQLCPIFFEMSKIRFRYGEKRGRWKIFDGNQASQKWK